jgi:hypothetical protein
MKALKFCMPSDARMELYFDVDGEGATPLGGSKQPLHGELLSVAIDDCEYAATHLPTQRTGSVITLLLQSHNACAAVV